MSQLKILILGGNRFFGLHLAKNLLQKGHQITLLNRGTIADGLGDSVSRIKADRGNLLTLQEAFEDREWDIVFDQICYTATEAEQACQFFKDRVGRYVVTSSESVFDGGENQQESAFDPSSYDFNEIADAKTNYQEAKRQVEVIFSRQTNFEVSMVRPSLVVGMDDYTNRLKWHIARIERGLPIYFPNIDIQSDFIKSDQAGSALEIIGLSKLWGPINCTTRGSMSLRQLVSMCEEVTQKRIVLASQQEGDNHSPYGGKASKTMNTDILYSLGFDAPPSSDWMYKLIEQIWKDLK